MRGRPTISACASARAQKRCSLHLYEPIELGLARLSLGASAAEARADALEEAMLAEEEERERLALEEAIERSLIDLS